MQGEQEGDSEVESSETDSLDIKSILQSTLDEGSIHDDTSRLLLEKAESGFLEEHQTSGAIRSLADELIGTLPPRMEEDEN